MNITHLPKGEKRKRKKEEEESGEREYIEQIDRMLTNDSDKLYMNALCSIFATFL